MANFDKGTRKKIRATCSIVEYFLHLAYNAQRCHALSTQQIIFFKKKIILLKGPLRLYFRHDRTSL